MIAHFVGGPLNGTERALEEDRLVVEVYEPTREDFDVFGREGWPDLTNIKTFRGEYRRVQVVPPRLGVAVPPIYVWVDERPFKFVVEVDAVRLREKVTQGLEGYHRAFTGGLNNFTVKD